MAWQKVETDIGTGVGRCKYSVSIRHGGARISVPKATVEKLGWTKATRLKLLVGGGELAGKLRLEPVDKGAITGRPAVKGGGLLIRLGRWPALAPRDVDAVVVANEIDQSALIVTLPVHAQAVAPAPRPATAHTGGVGKTDVTGRFFNDPPPGKTAMASGTRGGSR